MASSGYYSFVNVVLFVVLFQKNISVSSADGNCLNPTFTKDQKVVVDYYFNRETKGLSTDLCNFILKSNGLISIVFHMCDALPDKKTCLKNEECTEIRYSACYYKYHADIYNNCAKELPDVDKQITDCVNGGLADDILTTNESARLKLGIQKFPALVINQKYEPCIKDISLHAIKVYFCTAYANELPICKN